MDPGCPGTQAGGGGCCPIGLGPVLTMYRKPEKVITSLASTTVTNLFFTKVETSEGS